jgi:hypothetical protein
MTSDEMRFRATPEKEQLYPNGRYLIHRLWARRSGVDRHVCNVKATGSNPVESIIIFLVPVEKKWPQAARPSVNPIEKKPWIFLLHPSLGRGLLTIFRPGTLHREIT